MAPQTQDDADVQEDFGREPLPTGHPLAWGALVEGTILEGLAWPGWAGSDLGVFKLGSLKEPVAAGVTQ